MNKKAMNHQLGRVSDKWLLKPAEKWTEYEVMCKETHIPDCAPMKDKMKGKGFKHIPYELELAKSRKCTEWAEYLNDDKRAHNNLLISGGLVNDDNLTIVDMDNVKVGKYEYDFDPECNGWTTEPRRLNKSKGEVFHNSDKRYLEEIRKELKKMNKDKLKSLFGRNWTKGALLKANLGTIKTILHKG